MTNDPRITAENRAAEVELGGDVVPGRDDQAVDGLSSSAWFSGHVVPAPDRTPVPADLAPPAEPPATPKQESFLRSLLNEREMPASATHTGAERRSAALGLLDDGRMSKRQASASIEMLLAQPRMGARHGAVEPVDPDLPDVPAGRYAIRDEDDVVKFYKVDRPTEGRWAGRTFVSVQASDDLHPIRNPASRRAILTAIADDPQAASRLYGVELGSCGVCGRTLTDETSRAYGIGPVCRERTGW